MMAAYTAAQNGAKVTLLEQNEKLGKKLFITGKGRCNLTNACDISDFFGNVVTNSKFLFSSVYSFTNEDTVSFFEEHGLKLKKERGDRIFPLSDKSSDVIKTLENLLRSSGVTVRLKTKVENPDKIDADAVIIATGGLSYPSTGATGDGYVFAERLGHKIITPVPSLVPLICRETFIAELEGLSLKNIAVTVKDEKRELFHDFGEMLFTGKGVSGPVILTASSILSKHISREDNELDLFIDLKPALSETQLDARILRDFGEASNKEFKNGLSKLLPAKMIPVVVKLTGIDPYKKINIITKEERKKLIDIIKNFKLTVIKSAGFEQAVITSGGVDVKQIDPSTMESKLKKGIYFAGEVLDVDALTGGFNIQIALSTGRAAGLAASGGEK